MIFPPIGFSEMITLFERSKVEKMEYLASAHRTLFDELCRCVFSFLAELEPEL